MDTYTTLDRIPERPADRRLVVNLEKPTHYHDETPPQVKNLLDRLILARLNYWRLPPRARIYYGDTQTGRDWSEENDTMGYIGRSTGDQPIPILLHSKRSHGGGAILDNCIVKITVNHVTVYQHPLYHHGEFTIQPSTEPGYLETVYQDGQETANFRKPGQAQKFIDFMTGKRDSK